MRFNNFEPNLMLNKYTIDISQNRINIYTLNTCYKQSQKADFD